MPVQPALSVLMSATLICFIVGVTEPPGPRRRAWFHGLYASAALATLTKGLIGFLIPGAVMLIWTLAYGQWHRLRPLHLPTGTALFLAIAAPWHMLVALRNPEWTYFYFVHEHWLRLTTTNHGRSEPWWCFLPVIALGLFPWVGFLAPALGAAVRRSGQDRGERAATGFFVIWAIFIIVFFSLSGSKRIPCVLPAIPPLAILIGRWLTRERPADAAAWRWGWGACALLGVVFIAAVAVVALEPSLLRGAQLEGMRVWLGIAALGVAAGVALVCRYAWHNLHSRSGMAVFGMAVLFYAGVLGPPNARMDIRGSKELARIVVQEAGPQDPVFHYRGLYQDFLYYAERTVQLVDTKSELEIDLDPTAGNGEVCVTSAEFYQRWNAPGRTWVLLRRRHLPTLLAEPGFNYHLCRTPARSSSVSTCLRAAFCTTAAPSPSTKWPWRRSRDARALSRPRGWLPAEAGLRLRPGLRWRRPRHATAPEQSWIGRSREAAVHRQVVARWPGVPMPL